ncbi:YeeE/YedE family protein [Rhodovarius crocodyli]|uniref:YeeE/YedE family protein n=1 Tax=Rhodovarius crocodyli TaxID=1979269 RepID=A0A437M222_9PROT|nr:DUF6691 family protein [Rhodovarius crocodyli]RVT91747.1 YeeE/YedE family protein [Rhodovarius crocodyli]
MPTILPALAAGALFGLGLIVSGMANPAKVLAFLDIAGEWDPSLAFVMGGAIPVAALGFALAKRRAAPLCAPAFSPPTKQGLDARLLGGAALFGIGWGLAGFCPGPALASFAFAGWKALLFVAAMLLGMAAFGRLSRPAPGPAPR